MDCFIAYLSVSVYHLRFVDLFLSSERASESFYLFFISIHLNSSIQKNKKAKQSKRWFSLVWSGLVFGVLADIGYWIGFANVNLFISNSFVYFGLIS